MSSPANPRIVIIGAGPTGLGAGYRLQELGYDNWVLLEESDRVGGLAKSYVDCAGFTWDIGGHVMFSHYEYHDELLRRMLGDQVSTVTRQAWIWMENRFIGYPFQMNIRRLEPQTIYDCVSGAVQAAIERPGRGQPRNFGDWIRVTMGNGIADHFMIPYNAKVWATPPKLMSFDWIDERVAAVDIEQLLRNVLLDEPGMNWGPNSSFSYPLRGGSGFLWEQVGRALAPRLLLDCRVIAVDAAAKRVATADGRVFDYDVLLSTMPLDDLVAAIESAPKEIRRAARGLRSSGTHVVGIGIDRPNDSAKNWIYFPESDVPFYRVTYLSNYSPFVTPRPGQFSLLAETSWSDHKPEDSRTILARVLRGLVTTGLLEDADLDRIVARWRVSPAKSYPVPTLGRDSALGTIQPWLRSRGIWSRGRFGAWLYEIGNMDHSLMQGVEFADAMLLDRPERTWLPRGEDTAR